MNKTQLKKWMGEQNAKIIALGNVEVMSYTSLRVEVKGHDAVYCDVGLENGGTYANNAKGIVDEVIVLTQDYLEGIEINISDAVAYAVTEEVIKAWGGYVNNDSVIYSNETVIDLKKYGGEGTVTMRTYAEHGNDLLSIDSEQVKYCQKAIKTYLKEESSKTESAKVDEVKDVEEVKEVKSSESSKSAKDINIDKSFAGFQYIRVKNDKENYVKLQANNTFSKITSGALIGACIGLAVTGAVALGKALLSSNNGSSEEA